MRTASPDGQLVAVCQEVPAFDGPGFDVRLERPDGTLIRHVYQIGDGDPCDQIAWSPDGRLFAVLAAHVARVIVVDARWATERLAKDGAYRDWRQVTLAMREGAAGNLTFDGPMTLAFDLCASTVKDPSTGVRRCASTMHRRRLELPPQVLKD